MATMGEMLPQPERYPFTLLEEIGRGGMGVVWRARNDDTGEIVALKLLREVHADDPDYVARFEHEVDLARRIHSRNVVRVLGYGIREGIPYLAIEYVDGPSLRTLLNAHGPYGWAETRAMLLQIATGLADAHAAGVVHRDIKPSNILIDSTGIAKIADFGIARSFDLTRVTGTSTLLGTPAYLPPEGPLDERSDLYSLGVLAYELLTGNPPFTGTNYQEVILRHVREAPDLTRIPRPARNIVGALLAKDPGDRPQSAHVLVSALVRNAEEPERDDFANKLPPPSSPPLLSPRIAPLPPAGRAGRNQDETAAGLGERSQTFTDSARIPSDGPPAAADGSPAIVGAANRERASVELDIPLSTDFRYTHGPLAGNDPPPILPDGYEVSAIADRVDHSTGGAILVTGFRSVGKSSVVARAMHTLSLRDPKRPFVVLQINVARPLAAQEFLYELIRSLVDRLRETGQLERVDPSIRARLELAELRTSFSLNESKSSSSKREVGLTFGADATVAHANLGLGSTHERLVGASAQTYPDSEAEHDFLWIVGRLTSAQPLLPHHQPRLRLPGRHGQRSSWDGRLVVVVDELDKLTEQEGGLAALRSLIARLKNLLAARGVHFVFVGGVDLHDDISQEGESGNSLYASVFSSHLYVPCRWSAAHTLLARVLPENPAVDAEQLIRLQMYLDFFGRGHPGLLLQKFNSLVRWADNHPFLRLGPLQQAELALFASLETEILVWSDLEGIDLLEDSLARDRFRVAAHHLSKWVLRRDGEPFAREDFIAAAEQKMAVGLRLSTAQAERLFRRMLDSGLVQIDQSRTMISNAPNQRRFLLGDKWRHKQRLVWAAGSSEGEPRHENTLPHGLLGRRYRFERLIASGSMTSVYLAIDTQTGDRVTVKMLHQQALRSSDASRRLHREAGLRRDLRHPGVARLINTVDSDGFGPCLVSAFEEGPTLEEVINRGPISPVISVQIGLRLADVLSYLHQRGVARIDLKPANVVLSSEHGPVVVNLGVAKGIEPSGDETEATQAGGLVGSPRYLAPELFSGAPDADIRGDIYSFGLVLYEMLAGEPARRGNDDLDTLRQAQAGLVPTSSLRVSLGLRRTLDRCLAVDPSARFETPSALLAQLARCPEARTGKRSSAASRTHQASSSISRKKP